jgi:prepilin signal peptidase PulO-like enzyme (type II secretory pathway)
MSVSVQPIAQVAPGRGALAATAPAIAAAVIAAAAGIAAAITRDPGVREWALIGVFLAAAAVVVYHDIRYMRAPNVVVYPAVAAGAVCAATLGFGPLAQALGGGAIAFLLLLVGAAVSRGAMGMGDVKFGVVCGMVTGAIGVAFMLAASFVFGGVYALVMLMAGRSRRDVVPFTPFLVLGTVLALLAGRTYLGS